MAVNKLQITGMTCEHCVRNVKAIIMEFSGVKNAEVSLESGIAVIDGDVDIQMIAEEIKSLGYTVRFI